MDEKTIFTKTAKGVSEAVGKSRILPRDLRDILIEIDGTSSVEELATALGLPADRLREALVRLAADDYIHEFMPPVVADEDGLDLGPAPSKADSDPLTEVTMGAFLRAGGEQSRLPADARNQETDEKERIKASVARIRREALDRYHRGLEEQASREAKEKRRLADEEKARQNAQERERREAEERARREAELQIQKTLEERARQQAEAQARRAAEDEARREAEAELRRMAERERLAKEERDRKSAERQARRDAKARAKKERAQRRAEELAAREAQQRAEHVFAETAQPVLDTRTEQKPEHLAKEELMRTGVTISGQPAAIPAEESLSHEAAELELADAGRSSVVSIEDGKPYTGSFRKPIKWRKPAAFAAGALLTTGAAVALTATYDGKAAQLQTKAAAQFSQPVHIGKVRLALLPMPHWRLEDVTIGKEGQIRIARVDAVAKLGSLFSDKTVYSSVTLASPVVTEEGLGWLMFDRGVMQKDGIRVEAIHAVGARLASQAIELPAFQVNATFGTDGNWRTIALDSEDKTIHLGLQPQGNALHVDVIADGFMPPFGAQVKLASFRASGNATRDGLSFPKFTGKLLNGFVEGNAELKWNAGWKLEGDVKVDQIDTPQIAPQLLEGGKLDGSASYVMEAPAANALFPALRANGRFSVHNGALLGVNLTSVLRGISASGRSPFSRLDSEFSHEHGRTHMRNLHAVAGMISTNGGADIDAKGAINGRFAVDLKTPTRQTRAFVGLGGTLAEPRFHR
jgi:hypothetical protein